MNGVYVPIKEVRVYGIVKIPMNLFSKYFSGTRVDWCNGVLLSCTQVDNQIQSEELIKSQIFHIKQVIYCEMIKFPKELKNMYGAEVKILDATYSPLIVAIASILNEINNE